MLVVDAANVIGSRPDGWWRDRAGAAGRFVERVRAAVRAGRLDPPVVIVLEGRARAGADEGVEDGAEVVHAPGEGDDTIADIAGAGQIAAATVEPVEPVVTVVTADRGLARRVASAGADVVGPTWLLDRLGGDGDTPDPAG